MKRIDLADNDQWLDHDPIMTSADGSDHLHDQDKLRGRCT